MSEESKKTKSTRVDPKIAADRAGVRATTFDAVERGLIAMDAAVGSLLLCCVGYEAFTDTDEDFQLAIGPNEPASMRKALVQDHRSSTCATLPRGIMQALGFKRWFRPTYIPGTGIGYEGLWGEYLSPGAHAYVNAEKYIIVKNHTTQEYHLTTKAGTPAEMPKKWRQVFVNMDKANGHTHFIVTDPVFDPKTGTITFESVEAGQLGRGIPKNSDPGHQLVDRLRHVITPNEAGQLMDQGFTLNPDRNLYPHGAERRVWGWGDPAKLWEFHKAL